MFLIKILVSCFVNVWINRINKNIIVKIFVLIFFLWENFIIYNVWWNYVVLK